MNKKTNNTLVVLSVLLFVFLSTGSAYAASLTTESEKNYTELIKELEQKSITIYRIGPNGNILPIKIDLEEGIEDIGAFIEKKCDELFEKDLELQEYIKTLQTDEDNTKINISGAYGVIRIKSQGRGFHFKTKTNVRITTRFKLFKIMLPRIMISARKCLVFANYANDSKARTTFYPLIRSSSNNDTNLTAKIVEGAHSVIVTKFTGYTTWIGRFSNVLFDFDILPRAFSGVGRLVICSS
jgi:hypothetical protein